jgi:hypothetical protein
MQLRIGDVTTVFPDAPSAAGSGDFQGGIHGLARYAARNENFVPLCGPHNGLGRAARAQNTTRTSQGPRSAGYQRHGQARPLAGSLDSWVSEEHHVYDASGDLVNAAGRGSVRPSLGSHNRARSSQWQAAACPRRWSALSALSSPLDRRLACCRAASGTANIREDERRSGNGSRAAVHPLVASIERTLDLTAIDAQP